MAFIRVTDDISCNTSTLGGHIYLKFTHPNSGVVIGGGNETIEKLYSCLKLLLEQDDSLCNRLTLAPLKRERSSQPIQFKIDDEGLIPEFAEGVIGLMVQNAVTKGLDPTRLIGAVNLVPGESPPRAAVSGGAAEIDPEKLSRAFNVVLEGLNDASNKLDPVRVAAFLYNQATAANPDIRKEAAAFLAKNGYQSTDRTANDALVENLAELAQQFIAEERTLAKGK